MRLNPDFRVFEVAGRYLLLYTGTKAVDAKSAFELNAPTARFLQRIDTQDFSEEEMLEWLLSEYEVEREQAVADVRELVEILRERRMLIEL